MDRLKYYNLYNVPNLLISKYYYTNIFKLNKIESIMLIFKTSSKIFLPVLSFLMFIITGQSPVLLRKYKKKKIKKKIIKFKLRLLNKSLYLFLDKLINFSMPSFLEFGGLKKKNFVKFGLFNFNIFQIFDFIDSRIIYYKDPNYFSYFFDKSTLLINIKFDKNKQLINYNLLRLNKFPFNLD